MSTILVVDNNRSARQLLVEYLTGAGFRIISANNGREALFIANREKPNLILFDIYMPDMNGYQFLVSYRLTETTPVILMAPKEPADIVLGLKLGADDVVSKPFRLRELVARIRALLRRSGQAAEGFAAPRGAASPSATSYIY